jgi:hypothetical protein
VRDDLAPRLPGHSGITDPQVRRLVDRVEIEHAVLHWAHEVDMGRPDSATEFFSDDCVVDYGPRAPLGALLGRQSYVAMMKEATGGGPVTAGSTITSRAKFTSHHITDIVVHFTSPDRAESRCHCLGYVAEPDGGHHLTWGVFEDALVRGPEGWRIVRRSQHPLGRDNRPTRQQPASSPQALAHFLSKDAS